MKAANKLILNSGLQNNMNLDLEKIKLNMKIPELCLETFNLIISALYKCKSLKITFPWTIMCSNSKSDNFPDIMLD